MYNWNIRKWHVVAAVIWLATLLGSGWGGYALADCTEKPCADQTVKIETEPCEVTHLAPPPCICDCHCEVHQPSIDPCDTQPCPEIKIVPTGHFVGPAAGIVEHGYLLGAAYTYVKPSWAASVTAGRLFMDDLEPGYYRTWSRSRPTGTPGR